MALSLLGESGENHRVKILCNWELPGLSFD